MAVVTIITKNNDVAGVVPSPGNLVEGELAVNTTDRKLYTLDNGGNVVLISSGSDYDVPVTVTANSATPAVTITQSGAGGGMRITNTGAGNSLLVEDSANPDSTPFVVDASGNVGIGTNAPLTALNVNGTDGELIRISVTSNAGVIQEPALGFATGVTNTNPAAKISALEFDASDSRASLLFYTRGTNSDVAPTERLRITSSGGISFGSSGTAYGTAGQALISTGDAAPAWTDQFLSITFLISGGGSTVATGIAGDLTVPFNCEITEWTLLADQTGSVVVDIWKDTYANYPPTVADTITGSAKPTISAGVKGQSSTLTGWTTTITAGDTLRFNVDSAATLTRVTLSLKVKRT